MKRTTTAKGAPINRAEMEREWIKAWGLLPQSEIQRWIERIPHYIEQIIACSIGNEYIEGREKQQQEQQQQ